MSVMHSTILSFKVVAKNDSDPCRLARFKEVANWAGITVNYTLPQANLNVLASCIYGDIERPDVLSYVVTRCSATPDSYASNKMWPDPAPVAGFGKTGYLDSYVPHACSVSTR